MSRKDMSVGLNYTSKTNKKDIDDLSLLVKKKISSKDIALMIQKTNVLPIDEMGQNSFYDDRFDENGIYNDLIIKNEIKVIDAKEGGNQWLLGERFSLIRDEKLYLNWGFNDFSEYINKDTQYSRRKVYNCISVYKSFSFEHSASLGSKLSLIASFMRDIEDDELRDNAILEASKLSANKIRDYINNGEIETVLGLEEPKEVIEMVEISKGNSSDPISDIENSIDAEFTVNFKDAVIIAPSKIKDEEPYYSPANQKKIDAKPHQLQMGFDGVVLQKYFSKYIKSHNKDIKAWIEEELKKPNNKEDLDLYLEENKDV